MFAGPAIRRVTGCHNTDFEGSPVLAYDYPLLGAFWTLVIFSCFVLVLFVILWAFVDNFRRKDHSGWAKAGWFIFIICLPLLGVFVYLIARPADPVL
jgi:uncharacterized membrane protein YozB (DUF420 family)